MNVRTVEQRIIEESFSPQYYAQFQNWPGGIYNVLHDGDEIRGFHPTEINVRNSSCTLVVAVAQFCTYGFIDIWGTGATKNNEGVQYFNAGNYQAAYASYSASMAWKCAVAFRNMGFLFENGFYVNTNKVLAAKYYRMSYEQGNLLAQGDINRLLATIDDPAVLNSIGMMFHNMDGAQGVSTNYRKAFFWYIKAKVKGSTDACRNLGLLFEHGGYGITKDLAEAELYFRDALQMGYSQQTIESDLRRLRVAVTPSLTPGSFSYANASPNTTIFNRAQHQSFRSDENYPLQTGFYNPVLCYSLRHSRR